MDTVAFIPVRGGSKSIPYKNIKPLGGQPLVHWSMRAALDCPRIDRVYVSSEDPHIRSVANLIVDKRLKVIDRDPQTATDDASTELALLDFARKHEFDRVVLIQATSPLITGNDLTGALEKLDAGDAETLLSVVRAHRFFWRPNEDGTARPINYEPTRRPRRQEWDGELIENGAFYITSKAALLKSRCRISGRMTFFEMDNKTSLELDEPHDWIVAEQLIAKPSIPRTLAERCRKVELLVTDMDGVLTDSGVYVGPEGEVCKKFSTRDGMGFALLRRAGLKGAIMTSENSPIIAARAQKLKIDRVLSGVVDKGEALSLLLEEEHLEATQVAYIGDDINDLPALQHIGLSACPSNAVDEVKRIAHFVCRLPGGAGCVRELIDLILRYRM